MSENEVDGTDCLTPGGSSIAWRPSPIQDCFPAVLWATGFWVGGFTYGLCTVIFWIRCDYRRSYLGLRAGQVRIGLFIAQLREIWTTKCVQLVGLSPGRS